MDLDIQIHEEYKTAVVGYNGSGLPLGERNDLDLLAEMALTVDPSLKRYFKKLPTLALLKRAQAREFLDKNPLPADLK